MQINTHLNISTDALSVSGELIIRTPLPAMAISPTLPSDGSIIIASTEKALDFNKTMIMVINSVQAYNLGYVLEGIFQIPTTKGMDNH